MIVEESIKAIISKMKEESHTAKIKPKYILFKSKYEEYPLYVIVGVNETFVFVKIPKNSPYFEKQNFVYEEHPLILWYKSHKLPWEKEENKENWYWGFIPWEGVSSQEFVEGVKQILVKIINKNFHPLWEIENPKSVIEAWAKHLQEIERAKKGKYKKFLAIEEIKEEEIAGSIDIDFEELIRVLPTIKF
jgi:hypothetical protein